MAASIQDAAIQPAGSLSVNRAPCPSALSTVMSPPIARASRREMRLPGVTTASGSTTLTIQMGQGTTVSLYTPGHNLLLNSDGSIRSLNGYAQVFSVNGASRVVDERYFRLGMKISF